MIGSQAFVYCVMGVSGCGKSTVAHALAERLRIEMLDADDFHPPSNLEKMKSGLPLDDQDRAQWLATLNAELLQRSESGRSTILACSALKQRYRDVLQAGLPDLRWLYLKAGRDLIRQRMLARQDHFMPASLLDSQFADLEEPSAAIELDASQPVEVIVEQALDQIGNS